MVRIRYFVKNVEENIAFYTKILDFEIIRLWGKVGAEIGKGDFTILLSGSQTSAAKPMPNGDVPTPGGWNRFLFEVDSIDDTVAKLKAANVNFRNEVLDGVGGKQVLIEDPSGNPIEIFQSKQ